MRRKYPGLTVKEPESWAAIEAAARDGVPDLTHRNEALGNAVVPQVAEVVGRKILEIEARERVA
jgi:hypothetical protein